MGIVQNAPICVSSERFFTLSESVPRFTLRFYFSEVHNYKNCLQPQLPTHKCTSRHLGKQWTKDAWQIFRSSCDEGLQQYRIWSFPVLHLHTELDRKAYFPFSKAGFPAGAECSAFLPLTNIWKKTLFMLFFCCRQIPMSHSLPMFIHLRNMGSWQWNFFFWCPVILIWHFYYFWAAQVILGLSRIHTKLLAGKAAFPVVLSNMFWPRATGVASSEGVTSQQSWDTPRPQHSFLFFKKNTHNSFSERPWTWKSSPFTLTASVLALQRSKSITHF